MVQVRVVDTEKSLPELALLIREFADWASVERCEDQLNEAEKSTD